RHLRMIAPAAIVAVLTPFAVTTVPLGTATAADCIAAPNSAAPEGSHWYYRTDRVQRRKCWYIAPEDRTVRHTPRPPLAPSGPPRCPRARAPRRPPRPPLRPRARRQRRPPHPPRRRAPPMPATARPRRRKPNHRHRLGQQARGSPQPRPFFPSGRSIGGTPP